MEKAIEIKRRAQRCIQNGDLDGALNEYEKLVAADESDPYNYVLLADLMFKKGDNQGATNRYLTAAKTYEQTGLYKNGIAVCKKMMRLSLAPTLVLERLALLHALDGLGTEATLYYQQLAEHLIREDKLSQAIDALGKAFEACPENVKVLERLAETHLLADHQETCARTLASAARHYRLQGLVEDAERCQARAEQMLPGVSAETELPPPATASEPGHDVANAVEFRERTGLEESPPPAPAHRTWAETLGETSEHAGPPRLPEAAMHGSHPLDQPDPPSPRGMADGVESRPPMFEAPAPEAADPHPDPLSERRPETPGLSFDAPPLMATETPMAIAAPTLADVEHMLAEAQEHFRLGHREAAADKLIGAARSYEELGQHDHAASIYRSLCRTPQTSLETMNLWFMNCVRRADRREAAEVACEIGDRMLSEGDFDSAEEWFVKANQLDGNNPVAQRRLTRLSEIRADEAAASSVAVAPGPELAPEPVSAPVIAGSDSLNGEQGRVEVAVGRSEAVTFDLGALLSEFQRGIEAQLSGDAQGHYDLAMTYREMGLIEQSVESFRLAGRDPAFQYRCAEMVGRCLLDQGQFEEAASEFGAALQAEDLAPELAINMRYQLGLALEASGHSREALAEFERVFATQANFLDVALKIRVLRKTLEPA
ncbi:MAG TPA: hypothetical protein VEY91_06650 [Candidatus Limnocylindria bacterium]|nr:hypothetical protein [Candidatus Limnocylindria bacterium]